MNNNKGENLKVIVITHNRLEYTKLTIESLLKTVPDAKILVYDNNSLEDGMYEYIASLHHYYKNIQSYPSDINQGWGTAINKAYDKITLYDDDMVLLSNNDVEYKDGWYDESLKLYEKYPQIGILGLWKHTSHGIKQDLGDLQTSDQSAAVAWLLKPNFLKQLMPFAEHGPCNHKGGNGEDVTMCIKTEQLGKWVANPNGNLAEHLDGM